MMSHDKVISEQIQVLISEYTTHQVAFMSPKFVLMSD